MSVLLNWLKKKKRESDEIYVLKDVESDFININYKLR